MFQKVKSMVAIMRPFAEISVSTTINIHPHQVKLIFERSRIVRVLKKISAIPKDKDSL